MRIIDRLLWVSTDDRGMIQHHTERVTIREAEKIAGQRLDRRKRYRIINGEVCELCIFTHACSGCTPSYEEGGGNADRGCGCKDCGYQGRTVNRSFVPLVQKEGKS